MTKRRNYDNTFKVGHVRLDIAIQCIDNLHTLVDQSLIRGKGAV